VKATGAESQQILAGMSNLNRGLRIRIYEAQERGEGGLVQGPFDLLEAGTGSYATYLRGLVGQSFDKAKELLGEVQKNGGPAKRCSFILNCNELEVEASNERFEQIARPREPKGIGSIPSYVGRNIARWRRFRKLSRRELSRKAGLKSQAHVRLIESGLIRFPQIDTLDRIAEVLDVSLEELMRRNTAPD
jgi:DNA-binding Xre family transcriptional regulator